MTQLDQSNDVNALRHAIHQLDETKQTIWKLRDLPIMNEKHYDTISMIYALLSDAGKNISTLIPTDTTVRFGDHRNAPLADFRKIVRDGNFVVLDTETTGLHAGEIVQIAIIASDGDILLDTLVKPAHPIPADATAIHRITDDMVATAPLWKDVLPEVRAALCDWNVIVYNAQYDRKMLHLTNEVHGLEKIDWKQCAAWYCAMEAFAELYGDWNNYNRSYKWQPLWKAAQYYYLEFTPGTEHTALGDCLMTLDVIKKMSEV